MPRPNKVDIEKARKNFEKNRKDVGILGEFPSNYRVPHTDRYGTPLVVGDEVECDCGYRDDTPLKDRSWVDGQHFIVLKLGVSGGRCYSDKPQHLLQGDRCITTIPIYNLRKIEGQR